jgi:uncharacterized protein (DUF2147 family)
MDRNQAPPGTENMGTMPGPSSDVRLRVTSVAIGFCLFAFNAASAWAIEATAIEGRWRTADDRLIIDIRPCGEEFCGRRVILANQRTNPEKQCGRTVLTARRTQKPTSTDDLMFEGSLDLPDNGGAYAAVVTIQSSAPGKAAVMRIFGRGMNQPIFSRRMPFMVEMARIGDAACQPIPMS